MDNGAQTIPMTPTVEAVEKELSAEAGVSAWAVAQAILRRHFEFGRQAGRQTAEGKGPDRQETRPFDRWISELALLFDPLMVPRLHGRLVILGLARLEPALDHYLRKDGFLAALEDELREDFISLLRPEHVDPADAYRGTFIRILQNRGKLDSRFGKPRPSGFVILAGGGPGLDGLVDLCQRQSYNRCFTARYVVPSGSTLKDALISVVRDITGLVDGDLNTLGDLVPDPGSDEKAWMRLVTPEIRSALGELGSAGPEMSAGDVLEGLLAPIDKLGALTTGFRLVFFFEFRAVQPGMSAERLGFSDAVIRRLHDLPERFGVVFSGLPEAVGSSLSDPPFQRLQIPVDLQKTRAQALVNDTPAGPDRLDIASEVNALAESIALREMSPPMVVGVIGGWGAGKSFVLHLIAERIREIRCEPIVRTDPGTASEEAFPFIGHPYLIEFDAWTYAKSNLWASLMQTIFNGLDRQINLEQILCRDLGISLLDHTEIWRAISRLTHDDQDRLTKTDLGKQAIQIVADYDAGKRGDTVSRLWELLAGLRQAETDTLARAEAQLARDRYARDQALQAFEEVVDHEINRRARAGALRSLGDRLLQSAWERQQAGSHGKAPPSYEQLQQNIDWLKKFSKGINPLSLILLLVAVVTLFTPALFEAGNRVISRLTPLLSLLLGAGSWAVTFNRWLTRTRKQFDLQVADHERRFGTARKDLIQQALAATAATVPRPGTDTPPADGLPDFSESIKQKARALNEKEARVLAARADVAARRQRIGMTARHESLLALISNRLEGRFYEDKLGLLHQVKADLQELSDALLDKRAPDGLFPRGEPRIILVIDDLDRCPPKRVVEVLEAVQLLVKTPAFVVVLAIDVRYVTRALEMAYQGVLVRGGDPSGLDYIEKIIQVPYRVRPVSAAAVGGFLRAQMMIKKEDLPAAEAVPEETEPGSSGAGPQAGRDDAEEPEAARLSVARSARTELRVLPTDVLKFSRREHETISACCSTLEVNPRAMKRLVNVYKLLKIIWHRRGFREGPGEAVQKAMLALLVLGATYPEVMRQVLHAMERQYTLGRRRTDACIGKTVSDLCGQRAAASILAADWTAVADAFMSPEFFPREVTFRDLQEINLRLVSSFSFVGENDPQREAALRREGLATPPDGAGR
ncbi:hypothetical protein DSCA_48820 [Desulfosarcina alkanivorans]|uniref:KAP NTPase domain-containing protein n=1 Tax=Desulfosarcina alkanivorans TaxID=571177 RepID=A0A5K7YMH9_9BACT|nr:P-loop NTPase fold protein [Desulfosarcina alkanivorans]BBO70952.1 hypothetical protein DSCA_48820 [Desulfosarcina alkanivorans]